MTVTQEAIVTAADRLERAAESGVACEPVSDLLGSQDIDAAYRVQQLVTERRLGRGARLVGRKIGLTSEAVQRQIGVDRPDFGVLFDDMRFSSGSDVPPGILLQPKAEAEIAFLLRKDIDDATDLDAVRDAIELAFPALEIVDSRIADWRIGITDTVADNASSGVFVVGAEGTPLDDFDPADATMTMWRNGEVVSEGEGRACLGDPLNAVAWLARTAIDIGDPLRAGDLVLSGALGPMVTISPDDIIEARVSPLGSVEARFPGKEET